MANVNGFRSTPWFVGGGAQHSPEVARNMLHIASMRTEGIVGTSDLKVTPLNVPGQGVQIGTGSCLIRHNSVAFTQQTYSGFAQTASTLDVAPTGSGGGRSDLIIARVEDPFVANNPWQNPPDPTAATYIFPRVVPNVPAGTTTLAQAGIASQSAIVLGRIDLPPSTGTVTAGMITDLRKMAQPRSVTYKNFNQGNTNSELTAESYITWPPYAPGWEVPEWATHADCQVTLSGIYARGVVDGTMRLCLGRGGGDYLVIGPEQKYDLNSVTDDWRTGGGAQRFVMNLGCYGAVFPARGQILYQFVESHKLPNRPDRTNILMDSYSSMKFELTFYEYAI